MKIKNFLFLFLFLFPALVNAQVTIVRVENDTVFLDTSSLKTPIQKDDTFKVILSSEKITNPQTGKELGVLHQYSAEGKINDVQPLYAVGKLPKGTTVTVGQEVVFGNTEIPTAEQKKIISQHKTINYQPINQEIVSLSAASVTHPGANEIITLSNNGQITVWERSGESLKEKTSYQLPKNKTPVTLSAAPTRGQDTAEVFAVVYEYSSQRISTLVLAYENGKWNNLGSVPLFVKEMGCGSQKTVWAQKPFVMSLRPGNANKLVYTDGRFKAGKQKLHTQHNWLNSIANAAIESTDYTNFIHVTSNGKIKIKLANGKTVESKSLFASTPNRVKYKQEIVGFYPSLQTVQSKEKAEIVAVENTAKYGLLSSTFGMYQNGKVHFLSLEKGRLNITDTVELDGFVYDTSCDTSSILTAEIFPDGNSSVVEILTN